MLGVRSWYLNILFNAVFSILFKFKIDKLKFNATGTQNNGIWGDTTKGFWENKVFLNLPKFMFQL